MMDKPTTWQDEARDTGWVEFECHAPEGYFLAWEKVPDEFKAEIEDAGPIPCEGGGAIGTWCEDCRFCEYLR